MGVIDQHRSALRAKTASFRRRDALREGTLPTRIEALLLEENPMPASSARLLLFGAVLAVLSTITMPTGCGKKDKPVLKADLDIIKPDDTELADGDEESKGEVVQVNTDDDDGDAGSGANPTPDKEDGNGVNGENDLLRLKIHKLEPSGTTGFSYKLHFPSSKMAIWKQNNKTQAVTSDTTTFPVDSDTTVYVEGKSPSSNMDGEIITLRV